MVKTTTIHIRKRSGELEMLPRKRNINPSPQAGQYKEGLRETLVANNVLLQGISRRPIP